MAQDFDIDLLRAFVAVAECGGFTRAAVRLNRTQSTVSQQVQRLEQAAGAQLLLRETRQLQLTEEGDRMLAYGRRLLSLHDEARAAIAGSGHSGEVRVGFAEDFAPLALPLALAEFNRAHPRLHLSVVCDLSVALARRFRHGELDLVVVKQLPEDRSGKRLRLDPLVWLAGPGFVPKDDEPLPLCLFPPGCLFRDRVTAALDAIGRPWRIAYTSPSIAGLQAAVAAGIGLATLTAVSDRGGLKPADAQAWGLPSLGEIALVCHVAQGKRAAAAQDLARFVSRAAARVAPVAAERAA
jgi:DNA-binding transcriptional LysR family regulator